MGGIDRAETQSAYISAHTVQSAGYLTLKKGMEAQEAQAQNLMQMMMPTPSFGHTLDIRA